VLDDPCAGIWPLVYARLEHYPPALGEPLLRFAREVIAPKPFYGWRHPLELAHCFGLPRATGEALTVAHLLGYLALTLEEDLLDGDPKSALPPRDLTVLTTLLHWDTAATLTGVMGHRPDFWDLAGRLRARWAEATHDETEGRGDQGTGRQEDEELRQRAGKATGLFLAPLGVLLAAGRDDLLPAAERLLAAIYTAIVLLDDLQDWPDDLAAGRRNFLVELARDGRATVDEATVAAALAERGSGERLCAIVVERLRDGLAGAADELEPLRRHAELLLGTADAYAGLCRAGVRWAAAMLEPARG
jgi:hypothetical protein